MKYINVKMTQLRHFPVNNMLKSIALYCTFLHLLQSSRIYAFTNSFRSALCFTTSTFHNYAPHRRSTFHKNKSVRQQFPQIVGALIPSTPESFDPSIAGQFTIKICSSSSCLKRSTTFGLEDYALLSGLYQRKEENGATRVKIEEGTCMGRCKFGPCIGVEHEDYEGFVGLEGMEPPELSHRVFQK